MGAGGSELGPQQTGTANGTGHSQARAGGQDGGPGGPGPTDSPRQVRPGRSRAHSALRRVTQEIRD